MRVENRRYVDVLIKSRISFRKVSKIFGKKSLKSYYKIHKNRKFATIDELLQNDCNDRKLNDDLCISDIIKLKKDISRL